MVYGTSNELVSGANLDQLTSLQGPHCSYVTHRIHGAGIYANIGGILIVNVTIYSSTMDPSWDMMVNPLP